MHLGWNKKFASFWAIFYSLGITPNVVALAGKSFRGILAQFLPFFDPSISSTFIYALASFESLCWQNTIIPPQTVCRLSELTGAVQTGLSKPPNEIPRWEEMVRSTMMTKMLRMMVTMMRLRIVGMQGVRESNDGWRTNQHELHHQRNVHKIFVTLHLYLYHPHLKITKNY